MRQADAAHNRPLCVNLDVVETPGVIRAGDIGNNVQVSRRASEVYKGSPACNTCGTKYQSVVVRSQGHVNEPSLGEGS